jgi:FGGY-family pentulose kinase
LESLSDLTTNEFQEQSTTDIWNSISSCVRQVLSEGAIEPSTVRGIGFCGTCSLAVFAHDTNEPMSVSGPQFDKPDQNVVLWLDHRPVEEARTINDTHDRLLSYVGGKMSVEMEIPKILWLKNNMPKEIFDRCKFYDLTDALTYLATGSETRSFCSTVCKQGYVPVGVDGSKKGWKDEFFEAIGLQDVMKNDYIRLGGVDGIVSQTTGNSSKSFNKLTSG